MEITPDPPSYTIKAYRGESFVLNFIHNTDLEGAQPEFNLRRTGASLPVVTLGVGTGVIIDDQTHYRVVLTGDDLNLLPGEYKWDVWNSLVGDPTPFVIGVMVIKEPEARFIPSA